MKCIPCNKNEANSPGQLCSTCYTKGKGETILTEKEKGKKK